jgi:hypothetical protein
MGSALILIAAEGIVSVVLSSRFNRPLHSTVVVSTSEQQKLVTGVYLMVTSGQSMGDLFAVCA